MKKQHTQSTKRVLVAPVMSEKAMRLEMTGTYTFLVSTDATKIDIKKEVLSVYGVSPKKVRVINEEGKTVRFGRFMGRRKDVKKAMVTLPEGKSIAIHEGV